eukprot:TRINITY_DN4300_c4_g1_i1.p1 TRINITY_DN4300_c4_g1~~TRINITY_DN4300_c4_g1_i1.p1  ORF type:complete len:372 (+),score=43.82 TRINITY_DN4300_c4_g1_i1:35-1150(+)
MQLLLTYPDLGYSDVAISVTTDSLVEEAIQAAALEWRVDASFLEILFMGEPLPASSRLLSHQVEADSQLTVSLKRWIGKDLLTSCGTREQLGMLIKKGYFGPDRVLYLDTPTFTDNTGCVDVKKEWIPEGVRKICFCNPISAVATPAVGFLRGANITSVDLSGLRHITSIGSSFLSCTSIETIDFSPLSNVTNIAGRFLKRCCSLKSVDLSGLEELTTVDSQFLSECSSLSSVRLPEKLRSISDCFLYRCQSLTTIDASQCSFENIGLSFLHGCSSLEVVDASCLKTIRFLRPNFLCQCSSLKEISNISCLGNVNKVGSYFLYGCDHFAQVNNQSDWDGLDVNLRNEFEELLSKYKMKSHKVEASSFNSRV